MRRGDTAAARRYARALLEVAFAAPDGNPGQLRAELADAALLVASSADLAASLASPAVAAEAKEQIVEGVWAGGSLLLRRVLRLLVQRGRIGLLPDVARAFAEQWNAARGTVPAEAVSAVPLSPEQQQSVSRALGRVTGRDVELTATVDPELLGGVLVRIEGQVYDGTVRGRLRALRERLTAAD